MESIDILNIGLTWDGQSGAEVTIGTTHTLRLDMPPEFNIEALITSVVEVHRTTP